MPKISSSKARDLIRGTNGKLFGAEYVKRTTGDYRKGTYRTEVSKGVKGIGLKYNRTEHGLIGVYEMTGDKQGHKSIPCDEGLKKLIIDGTPYTVEG